MSAPTGSQLTLAGATIAVAQPLEQLLRLVAGVHVEDLKWALSMAAGLAIGATGIYLHIGRKAGAGPPKAGTARRRSAKTTTGRGC